MAPAASRRSLLASAACLVAGVAAAPLMRAAGTAGAGHPLLKQTLSRAQAMPGLRTLLVAHDGEEVVRETYAGGGSDELTNIKSVAKTIVSALVGAAIDRGVLEGVDQPVAPLLGDLVPDDTDPRVARITVDHLLTMRAGLQRTSGPYYGRWVTSANWVAHALSRPFVAEPGGRMLYSTGSYHLLSAVLTRASGSSTLELARRWLGMPLNVRVPPWDRDPQGFYFGGNNMALTPRALLRFGEMYRRGGQYAGRRVIPADWVERSWTPRTRSSFTDHQYGYGWFIRRAGGRNVYYAWGYGGQMIHVVPDLALTVVMTSDPTRASGRGGYVRRLHALVEHGLMAVAESHAFAPGAAL